MTQTNNSLSKFVVGSKALRVRRAIALTVTFFLFVVVGFLTLVPINVPPTIGGNDKVHHVLAFAALVFPCALLYKCSLFWMIPAILIFGMAIELIQPQVGRQGEWADFYADFVGVIVGTILGLLLRRLSKVIRQNWTAC